MKLTFIQINIWHGTFLDRLVEFLRTEEPDIVTMQEVTGGRENFWHDQSIDTFHYIQDALGMEGMVAPMFRLVGDPTAYEGTAVLTRGNILGSTIVRFKEYQEYAEVPTAKEGPELPRNALDVTVDCGGTPIHVISTHGAWTREPIDTPEKIRQAKALGDYVKGLGNAPFVLGGDFNMAPGSKVINTIDHVARNAVYGSTIQNTLNLRVHRAAAELPRGILVDFIYTSSHFNLISIDAPQVDVSDHVPVRAVLSFRGV